MNDLFLKLAEQFADSVIAQNALIFGKHDSKTGNKFARKYNKAAEVLINGGIEGLEAFTQLLKDERAAVRVMAASYLLPYRTNESINVLQQEAKGKGITAFGAFMSLKRWEGEDIPKYDIDRWNELVEKKGFKRPRIPDHDGTE